MNILFCDPQKVRSVGTGITHIYGVQNALSQMGHNVVRINKDRSRSAKEINANPKLLWGSIKNAVLRWRIIRPIGGEIALLRFLLREIYVFVLATIALLRHKGKIDVIYRRHNLFNTEYLLSMIFNIPLVKEVNGLIAEEIRIMGLGNRISLRVMYWIERFNMSKADKLIVVTSKLKEVLQEEYQVPGDKIVVIPNGANTDLFQPMDAAKAREILNLNQSNDYVCFVGSLYPWQGLEYLIKSTPLILQECPDTRFLIVGDGPMKQELINLAEQVGVSENMTFKGMVPYPKVPQYINASAVCVVLRAEAKSGHSPLKLYEYMACGKPVVATRVSGFDILEEYRAGLLVNPEDYQGFANVVTMLLKNRELGRELGKNGRKYVVESQNWDNVAQRVANVCQSLVKSRKPR